MQSHETSYADLDSISMTLSILLIFGTTISIQPNRIERYVVKYDVKLLNESVDSHQAALDLAATQPFLMFDWFLTFTCNQAEHHGISHGAVMQTEQHFLRYPDGMMNLRLAVRYQCRTVLHQLWLQYITFNLVTVMGKVAKVFYRYEHQQKNSNHVHCIMALH